MRSSGQIAQLRLKETEEEVVMRDERLMVRRRESFARRATVLLVCTVLVSLLTGCTEPSGLRVMMSEPCQDAVVAGAGFAQLSDGALVMRRDVFRTDAERDRVLSHQELILARIGDEDVAVDPILGAPRILAFATAPGTEPEMLFCLSSDSEMDSSLRLSAMRISKDGLFEEAWTHEFPISRAVSFAVAGEGEDIRVGLLHIELDADGVASKPRLDVFDVRGAAQTLSMELPGFQIPERLHPYISGDSTGWLVEWREDSGTRLTLGTDDSTKEVAADPSVMDRSRVLAVGDLVEESPGDEILMGVGGVDTESRRLVIARLSETELEIIADLGTASCLEGRIADVDGDGRNDIVGREMLPEPAQVSHRAIERVTVWLSGDDGFGPSISSEKYEMGIGSLGLADLDGDGVLEVLVGYERGLTNTRAYMDVLEVPRRGLAL